MDEHEWKLPAATDVAVGEGRASTASTLGWGVDVGLGRGGHRVPFFSRPIELNTFDVDRGLAQRSALLAAECSAHRGDARLTDPGHRAQSTAPFPPIQTIEPPTTRLTASGTVETVNPFDATNPLATYRG